MSVDTVLRPLTYADLELVLSWRNSFEVRSCMFSNVEITLEEHLEWFEQSSNNPNTHLMVIERDRRASGCVNITQVSDGKISDWSFHTAPGSEKGTGYLLCKLAMNYAFGILGMRKLNAQVLGFNEKSIAIHEKLGFRQEGLLRDNFYRDGKYIDVLLFGMTESDWRARHEHL
ncbi:hypothetical protein GCM10011348_33030 [Marinobacterium nitratireducens]|uniref:N-acetyltransferase domain-containing protein n=1 Tax=Marinobacterium nitratireducens TaxID=518897 RepID=A0A917ZM20_9GAMM|nr:UDP-4-amino-4,6-dideoxy-N-acetyl-beta-L-altrosamine N-acetyltransferase [Marinobacterium nitratireducens]GGO85148.1 hypothetical protein GCM10011348_33030 [Marinobacterium nitratireducens]